VEAFCYKKKKAQARCSSQVLVVLVLEDLRSYASSETHEFLMLLRCLVASTPLGAVGSVTQSSTLGPPSTPSGTYPWYLDSGASFHMTPHSAHLSSLHPSYHHCIIHTTDGSPLSVARQGTLSSDSFYVPDVSLVPDLTMRLMSAK
jgi:hypothetical protein